MKSTNKWLRICKISRLTLRNHNSTSKSRMATQPQQFSYWKPKAKNVDTLSAVKSRLMVKWKAKSLNGIHRKKKSKGILQHPVLSSHWGKGTDQSISRRYKERENVCLMPIPHLFANYTQRSIGDFNRAENTSCIKRIGATWFHLSAWKLGVVLSRQS